MKDLINSSILAVSFLVLFGIAELIYYYFKAKAEYTRKLVHTGTGLITLLFPLVLSSHWFVLLLCSSFMLILIVSLRFNFLKSINAIERKSHGSIAYPIAVYMSFVFYTFYDKGLIYFYLPILILAISDPLAALFGKRWPFGKYMIGNDNKTMVGSVTFFISAIIINFSLITLLNNSINSSAFFLIAGVALFATIAEAISGKGIDNITIPGAVILSLAIFQKVMDL